MKMRFEIRLFVVSLAISCLLLGSLLLYVLYALAHERRGMLEFVIMGFFTYPIGIVYGFDTDPPVVAWLAAGLFEILMVALLTWGVLMGFSRRPQATN